MHLGAPGSGGEVAWWWFVVLLGFSRVLTSFEVMVWMQLMIWA